jgi:2-dehydropantoate 2-reductase
MHFEHGIMVLYGSTFESAGYTLTIQLLALIFNIMRIAVIGCGGVGGVAAGVLGSQMPGVVCADIDQEIVSRINEHGIILRGKKLRGKKRNLKSRVSAVKNLADQDTAYPGLGEENSKFDIIIITVKSMVLRKVFEQAKNFLSEDGLILTLQNGIEILEIVKDFPGVKTVAGAVGYNAQMYKKGEREVKGECNVTARGGIEIGNLTTGSEEDLLKIKKIFEPGIKIDISNNIIGTLWSKLLIVCGITGLGGCSGLPVGGLLRRRVARHLFYSIVTEGFLIAERLNIHLEKFGPVNPGKFGNHKDAYSPFMRYLLLKLIGTSRRKIKSNFTVDIERGNTTEVDFINGAVVKAGIALNIDTPVNSEIVRVTKEIEKRIKKVIPENLNIIARRCDAAK